MLLGPAGRHPEAGDDLVEDQQAIVRIGQGTDLFEIAGDRRRRTRRLEHDAGDLAGVRRQRVFQRFDVAVGKRDGGSRQGGRHPLGQNAGAQVLIEPVLRLQVR